MAKKIETIKRIKVHGFKSIADEQEIELRPLTLLSGANSSGKSSIMQPILLLKQTIEAPSDPGALLLDGPDVRFTRVDQLLSHVAGQEISSEFSLEIELSNENSIKMVYKKEKGISIDVAEMTFFNGVKKIRIVPGMTNEEIKNILPPPYNQILDDVGKKVKDVFQWAVYRERCFFTFDYSTSTHQRLRMFIPNNFISPGTSYISHLRHLIHLPGLRGNPSRTYQKNSTGPDFPGTFENYVASIINDWYLRKDNNLNELGISLEDMGLTWKVSVKPVDDTQVELLVGRLTHGKRGGAHDLVSIADVGFGLSQVLPVVVALIAAKPGQIVYLEQPEIHLHPRAQRKLAHVINSAVKRNVVVVVETHSALLLREIQTLVAKGELPSEKVILHWFQRQEDGRTVVTSAEPDENGAYGQWPEDFDEVGLGSERDYLDAVENRVFQQ
jgi:predicted ATPase